MPKTRKALLPLAVLCASYMAGANAATDQVVEKLCEELNATETVFPRTHLRLVLKLGST